MMTDPAATISLASDKLIRRLAWGIAGSTAAAGLIAAPFGLKMAGGVIAGGALTYFNFVWFARIVRGVLTGTDSPRWFAVKTAAKVLALYGAVTVVIWLDRVDPIGFLIGLTSLVVSVAGVGLTWRAGPEQQDQNADLNRDGPDGPDPEV